MKRLRIITILLSFVLLISLISACKPNSVEQPNEMDQESSPNPVTLVTVSMHGGTDPNTDNYNAINEKFLSDHPYVSLEDQSQISDQAWKTKIAADFSVGNEPDVIQYFTDANASDVLAADKFVSIDEIRSIYPDYAKDTLPEALEAATNPDGISRAVPTTFYWEGLYCNVDLFQKYNLELPTDWDKLLKAISTFRSHNITPIAVSLNHVPHYWIEFLILSSAGAESYTSIPSTAPLYWVKGLEYFKTLRDLGAFPIDTDIVDENYINEMFHNKKAAMTLNGSWFLSGIKDQENTVVCSFPNVRDGRAEKDIIVTGISSGFYITKKAWNNPDKRDAAVEFVMAHTSSKAVQNYWGGNGQAAAKVNPIKGLTPLAKSGINYSEAASIRCAPIDSRISQEAYSVLVAGIVDVSTGARSAEDLLNEVLKINAK